mmetsp:Transcript_76685/g.169444  ORF Transcript_76685/g.169444 Transcript_76685/m.169444 type:complete len:102 (+) Transcript_76685:765-1070(+)
MSHRREDFAAAVASSRLDVLAAGVPEAAGLAAPGSKSVAEEDGACPTSLAAVDGWCTTLLDSKSRCSTSSFEHGIAGQPEYLPDDDILQRSFAGSYASRVV